MPYAFDLKPPIYQGDDQSWTVTVYTNDGSPYDLTDATLTGEIRLTTGSPVLGTFVIEKNGATPNIFTMTVTKTVARSLPVGDSLHYDVEAVFGSTGRVVTILAGKAPVVGDITNSTPVLATRRERRTL